MARLQILGPRRLLPEAIRFLQARGAVQLRRPSAAPGGRALALVHARAGEVELERALSGAVRRIDAFLDRTARLPAEPAAPAAAPDVAATSFPAAVEEAAARLDGWEARRAALLDEARSASRLRRLLAALAPLRAEVPTPAGARALGLALRAGRRDALPVLEREVARLTDGRFDLRARDAGAAEVAVLLTVPRAAAAAVLGLLFEQGVEEVKLPPALAGETPARAQLALLAREQEIPAELEGIGREARLHVGRWRAALAGARRQALDRLARLGAQERCAETDHAFVVSGWTPRDQVEGLEAAVRDAFGGKVSLSAWPVAPGEEEDVPVVLRNPPLLRPFERLLGLVPLPRYGSVDPTPFLALFFPLFFGLVLGDLAFGALGLLAAALVWVRKWGGPAGRDLAIVAGACSLSSALFGLLYGEALGDLGRSLGLRPLLLDRREAILPFLGLAIGAGILHLALGLSLGVADAVRARAWRRAADRASRLGVLAAALVLGLAAAGRLPGGVLPWAAAALAACAAAGIAAGGPMAVLEWVLALGNVLSYARLMALGLASALLADVANALARTLQPRAAGLALGALLHAVNFTLCLVSPAVAALRLQVVEFFDKFYREGGSAFRPLAPHSP